LGGLPALNGTAPVPAAPPLAPAPLPPGGAPAGSNTAPSLSLAGTASSLTSMGTAPGGASTSAGLTDVRGETSGAFAAGAGASFRIIPLPEGWSGGERSLAWAERNLSSGFLPAAAATAAAAAVAAQVARDRAQRLRIALAGLPSRLSQPQLSW